MPKFYALHYVSDSGSDSDNLRVEGKLAQHRLYASNGEALARSLKKNGYELTIVTNNADYLGFVGRGLGEYSASLKQIAFELDLPKNLKFNAPHRKIELMKWLSEKSSNEYSIILDLDVYCLRRLPASFDIIERHGIPICYDITDQAMPAYGEKRLLEDYKNILKNGSHERSVISSWMGGEFIGGDAKFYAEIVEFIGFYINNYFEVAETLHHQGDEILVSAAINAMKFRDKGLTLFDAGTMKIIARYWYARTKHHQINLKSALQCSFIHLPNGKDFLAGLGENFDDRLNFEKMYKQYRLKKIIKMPWKYVNKKLLNKK